MPNRSQSYYDRIYSGVSRELVINFFAASLGRFLVAGVLFSGFFFAAYSNVGAPSSGIRVVFIFAITYLVLEMVSMFLKTKIIEIPAYQEYLDQEAAEIKNRASIRAEGSEEYISKRAG